MKIKKIIVSTFLAGVAGLGLVACGSKSDNAKLVDDEGNEYTVEKTDDPEEIAKVIDSIVREASTPKKNNEHKYGIDICAKGKAKFKNNETDDKYEISADVDANVRLDIPSPEKDDEGYTEEVIDYINRIGFSAGVKAVASTNFPGIAMDLEAGLDIYTDEANIYAQLGNIDLAGLVNIIPEGAELPIEGLTPQTIISLLGTMSGSSFKLNKEALFGLIPEDGDFEISDLAMAYPFIDAFIDNGIGGVAELLSTTAVYDAYYGEVITDEEDDEDDEDGAFASFAPIVAPFCDTFGVSISKVKGSEVTFAMPLTEYIGDDIEEYFEGEYTAEEIKESIAEETVLATLYAIVDVAKVRPVQIKVEFEDVKDQINDGIENFFTRDLRTLNDVVPATTTSEEEISDSTQNYMDFMAALAVSECTSFEGSIVIDFLYGEKVKTISNDAKSKAIDVTDMVVGLVEGLIERENERLR